MPSPSPYSPSVSSSPARPPTSGYEESLVKKGALVDAIKYTDGSFFRLESEQKLLDSIGNDSLFLDYNGVGFAGHTERRFVSPNLSRLGLELWSSCWNSYDAGLPAATDSLLGIKYVLSERDLAEEKQYIRRSDLEGLAVYENPYALPVALVSDSKIDDVTIAECELSEPAVVVNVAGTDTRVLRSFVEEIYRLCKERGACAFGARHVSEKPVDNWPDSTRLHTLIDWSARVSFAEGIAELIRAEEEKAGL